MARNMLKTILCLALALLFAALPAVAETGVEERLSDLETLRAGLEEGHYDLFALVTPTEWEARVEAAAETLRDEDTDDITACYALIELAASLGDAHTQAWFSGGNAQGELHALPLQTGLFSGRVYLLATTEPYADYLGMEITAIAGVPMAEVFARLTPAHQLRQRSAPANATRRQHRRREGLRYVGILNDASQADVTFTDAQGAQHTATIEALVGEEMYTAQFFLPRTRSRLCRRTAHRTLRIPKLRRHALDRLLFLRRRPGIPMADFVENVAAELEAGNYAKVCVDLRYNGGGNSSILEPLIDRLAALRDKTGLAVYALIGENTFSSAVMNAAQLKTRAGATLVGTPTGGSANHYGEIQSFTLEHLPLTVYYSTKYFAMLPADPTAP